MATPVAIKEANVHRLFEITLLLKALHSLLEIVSGAVLGAMSTDTVLKIAKFVTQSELLEDPNDLIANYLLQVAQDLSVSSKGHCRVLPSEPRLSEACLSACRDEKLGLGLSGLHGRARSFDWLPELSALACLLHRTHRTHDI